MFELDRSTTTLRPEKNPGLDCFIRFEPSEVGRAAGFSAQGTYFGCSAELAGILIEGLASMNRTTGMAKPASNGKFQLSLADHLRNLAN